MSTLGNRLKELREEYNMTQKQLADFLGLKSYRSIQYMEADKSTINNIQLVKLADHFNVSLDYLVGRSDVKY